MVPADFCCMGLICSLSHIPQIMAIGEDSSVDEPVNRQLHLQAQVSSPHNSVGSASMPTQDQSTCQSLAQFYPHLKTSPRDTPTREKSSHPQPEAQNPYYSR